MSVQMRAANILQQVAQGTNLSTALALELKGKELNAADCAALRDISYGCQRYRATLNFYLRELVPKPLKVVQAEQLLTVAIYQLAYTRNAEYAVVNNAVQEASQFAQGHFRGLANAVLRNFIRRKEQLVTRALANKQAAANHPLWWLKRLQKDYPDAWQSIIDAGNSHPPFTLRVNRRKTKVNDYLALLAEDGLAAHSLGDDAIQLTRAVGVNLLPKFADGWVSVQDFGAQQAALHLDLQSGQRVLDACAAPGGKACHILELSEVDLTALDVDATRLKLVQSNLQRLGLSAHTCVADANDTDKWWDGKPYQRILADVPCTASGVVRRNPDIKWLRQPNDANKIAAQQAPLLDSLWSTLAVGGKMLYATCSVFAEENQLQIAAFLARHNDAVLLKDEQLLPNENHDGFYYASLEKNA